MRLAEACGVTGLLLAGLGGCRSGPVPEAPAERASVVAEPLAAVRVSELVAGEGKAPAPEEPGPYAADAEAIAEGRRLFLAFNCAGCHGEVGGGGIGPPFVDADWIYGGSIENIYASIIQGRPNGMPAFGERMTGDPVWKIAAFVASLGEGARRETGGPRPAQGRTDAGAGTGARGP